MRELHFIFLQIAASSIAVSCQAQGTFQNLDFEAANPIIAGQGTVTAASAIPDWTAEINGTPVADIEENFFSAGAPEVTLLTSNPQQPPLDGSYSVLLTGSAIGSASISQTGFVPVVTQSLLFYGKSGLTEQPLEVFIGTQPISFSQVGSGPNYTIYGANISAWSGNSEQLTFTAPLDSITLNNWEIDDISFSPNPITTPEPDALTLMGIGGLLFGLYRRIQTSRK